MLAVRNFPKPLLRQRNEGKEMLIRCNGIWDNNNYDVWLNFSSTTNPAVAVMWTLRLHGKSWLHWSLLLSYKNLKANITRHHALQRYSAQANSNYNGFHFLAKKFSSSEITGFPNLMMC